MAATARQKKTCPTVRSATGTLSVMPEQKPFQDEHVRDFFQIMVSFQDDFGAWWNLRNEVNRMRNYPHHMSTPYVHRIPNFVDLYWRDA